MNQSQNIILSAWELPGFQYCFAHQTNANHPDVPEQPHIHDCYEIYVNVSAEVSFLVNNRLYTVKRGDAIVTRPGDVHICIHEEQQIHERFCFWLNCPEDSPLLSFAHRDDFTNHIHFSDDTRRELLRLLFSLKDAEDSAAEPARSACIFRILTIFSQRKQPFSEYSALAKPVQQVLDFIQNNFVDIHCVNDIVTATHVSGSTLNRWFREHLRLSPHKYVEALKLSHAQKLLLEGRSVTDVCINSGFSDCSRFISVFKGKFGETPLQYQKRRGI